MREPEVTSLARCFCFLIKQVHTCTPIHENTESCKSSFSPHKANVKAAQCSSTVLVLVLLQVSFSAGVGKKLCLQSGFDKNLQSCLAGLSRILSKHESILKRCKMTMGLEEYIIQQTGTENAQTYQAKHSRSYSLDLTPNTCN